MPTITRARAQAIAREAMVTARDKAEELQDDDRVALSGALKTLEESAVEAMAGGDSVNDVLGDLAESIDLTVQSIDDALGLSDEDERQEALDATVSALDDASVLIDVNALDIPDDGESLSGEETFESAALDFDQSGWSGAAEEDTSSASTALKRGLAQRRTEVVRSESADEESDRFGQQEVAVERAAEGKVEPRLTAGRTERREPRESLDEDAEEARLAISELGDAAAGGLEAADERGEQGDARQDDEGEARHGEYVYGADRD